MKYFQVIGAFVIGIGLGIMIMLAIATSNVEKLGNQAGQLSQSYEAKINTLNDALARDEGKIAGLQIISDACQANFEQGTVLYDTNGSAIVSVPLFHGLFDLSVAPSSPQTKPRWIIPARIKPMVVAPGNGITGVSYRYLDPKTGTASQLYTPEFVQ